MEYFASLARVVEIAKIVKKDKSYLSKLKNQAEKLSNLSKLLEALEITLNQTKWSEKVTKAQFFRNIFNLKQKSYL